MTRPSPVAEREARRAWHDSAGLTVTEDMIAAAIDRALKAQRAEFRRAIVEEWAWWPGGNDVRQAFNGLLARLRPARKGNRK